MKNQNDVCIIIQARLGSTRIPNKMIKPFNGSTLVDILFNKIKQSKIIPLNHVYFSAYEDELKEIANKHNIQIYHRTETSAKSIDTITEILEWHDKLPYKYVILISACNPLLTIETIDEFYNTFIHSNMTGLFGVVEKKTYYWSVDGTPITDWKGHSGMNTQIVTPVLEAAHCLYASPMDIIKDGYWMDKNSPANLNLFKMNEIEAFDIDYEWQFKVAEQLYKNREELWKK